jgi:hypothetical protein
VFEIASYKGLVIALILANGELLKIELFDDTCEEFWDKNVIVHAPIALIKPAVAQS